MSRPVSVAVIVRQWNAGAMVERALQDFETAHELSQLAFSLIVCNDGSFDGSERLIGTRDNLHCLTIPSRVEYCAALNHSAAFAMLHYDPDYLLFLNADLWGFSPLFADKLIAAMDRHKAVVWVTPTVYSTTGVNVSSLRPRRRLGLEFPLSTECHMIKSSAFLEHRGFDETLVRYYEDVDLFTRIKRSGMNARLTGTAHVIHEGSGLSSRQVFVRSFFGVRNSIVIWRRYRNESSSRDCARSILSYCRPHVVGTAKPKALAYPLWVMGVCFGIVAGAWRATRWSGGPVEASRMKNFERLRSLLLLADRPLETWACWEERGSVSRVRNASRRANCQF